MRDAFCADDADPTGIYVGTRDGCVYASADEGDTFTLVAAHLPDVLTVRAAPAAVTRAGGAARRPRRPGRRRQAPDVDRRAATLADLLDALADEHPMLGRRIRDETGSVRRFVNVYVDGDDVRFGGRAWPTHGAPTARRCRCCRRSPAAEGTVTGRDQRAASLAQLPHSCWSS